MEMVDLNKTAFFPELFLRAPVYSFTGYDLDKLEKVLKEIFFQNALWLASPGFFRRLETKDFESSKLTQKEIYTLQKYYNRMCFRPTPFGSFATFALAGWQADNITKLSALEDSRLHLLPDQSMLDVFSSLPKNNTFVYLSVNPTFYVVGKNYRFVQSIPDDKGHYRFLLAEIPVDNFYRDLFGFLRNKSFSKQDLISWIVSYAGCTVSHAQEYLAYFIKDQILISSDYPGPLAADLLKMLQDYPQLQSFWKYNNSILLENLGSIKMKSSDLDSMISGELPDGDKSRFYTSIESNLKAGGVPEETKARLMEVIPVLKRLAMNDKPKALSKFIAAFKRRFDLQRVPLLLALDPDAGVPYGKFGTGNTGKIMEQLNFPDKHKDENVLAWTPAHRLLFNLWKQAQSNGAHASLEITDDDLDSLNNTETALLPPSMAIMFRETEDHLLVEHAGGVTGTSLIGRFSVFSEQVHTMGKQLALQEEVNNPDVIFADINLHSDKHTDNINRRKPLYQNSIPVNVYADFTDFNQINLNDLIVFVRGDEIFLESVSRKKRVIPRLTTAYNYLHNELAIFRFLGDLQGQGLQSNLNLNMERYFPGLSFYPRVSYKNTVISLSRWHFNENQLVAIQVNNTALALAELRKFREHYAISQRVSIGTADQQLVFDLGNKQESIFFLSCLKGVKELTVQEYLLPARTVKANFQPLAGQFIAFLINKQPVYHQWAGLSGSPALNSPRNFQPGSEWLYVKIYCTPESANEILLTVVQPVLKKHHDITSWFFIRYVDQANHLRLRYKITGASGGNLLTALHHQIKETELEQLIGSFQVDVYQREIERYGAEFIDFVEDVFYTGSELCLAWLLAGFNAVSSDTDFDFALFTAYEMIIHFWDDKKAVDNFIKKMAASFLREFALDKKLKIDLDQKYRAMRTHVEQLLNKPMLERTDKEHQAFIQKIKVIREHASNNSITQQQALLADLVHMQLNRSFHIKQRQQELIVYHFLDKFRVTERSRKIYVDN